MRSNLDVWAIQFYPNELYTALDQIKGGISIIYSNCYFNFRIGDKIINTRSFDTFLYNEESEVLIMLMSGGEATKDDMIKYLESKNLLYGEVTFDKKYKTETPPSSIPEIWIAREKYVLDDALDDSINKGCSECIYYPYMEGALDFSYRAKSGDAYSVDGRLFRGILRLEDKIILIVHQIDNVDAKGNSRNIKFSNVTDALINRNIKFRMILGNDPFYPPIKEEEKMLKK